VIPEAVTFHDKLNHHPSILDSWPSGGLLLSMKKQILTMGNAGMALPLLLAYIACLVEVVVDEDD
jgi:hypothetical protein